MSHNMFIDLTSNSIGFFDPTTSTQAISLSQERLFSKMEQQTTTTSKIGDVGQWTQVRRSTSTNDLI